MAWKMLRGVAVTAVVLFVLVAICDSQKMTKTKKRAAVKKSMPPSKVSKVSAGLSSPLGSVLEMICSQPLSPKFGNKTCSANARRMVCTGMCPKGWRFPSKKPTIKIQCSNYDGTWTPSNRFPDCEPECQPPCKNGGRCEGNGRCSCTKGYRGKLCQHPISNCDMNSVDSFVNIKCNHTNTITRCQISCPAGTDFETAPPDDVTCSLDGKWTPSVIPSCKPINVVIHPEPESIKKGAKTRLIEAHPDLHSGICTTWKQEHFRTFDGRVFNIKGTCTYLLVKDCNFNTFAIHLEMDTMCEGGNCRPTLHIFMDNTKFEMRQTDTGPKVFWEGHEMTIPASYGSLTIELVTYYIIIRVPRVFHMLWDGKDSYSINVDNEVAEKTCGLCGKNDGNITNDFTTVDGSITRDEVTFFNSWKMDKLGTFCPDAYERESSCHYDTPEAGEIAQAATSFCSRLKSPEYAVCTSAINPDPYIEACKLEYCSCKQKNENCGCSSLETFFRECLIFKFKFPGQWRKPDFCPMECPHGMIYDDCGSPCPRTCKTGLQKCEYDYCMDGCHCPQGTVMHGNSCIAADDCPCQFQGTEYAVGSRIQQDCNSCTCYGGKWECSREQCEARCTTVGDPHYTTFDGRRYDFMGKCSYYLMKGDDYSIEHENVACTGAISKDFGYHVSSSSDFPSCTKSLTIQIQGTVIHLKQGHEVLLNGREITDFPFTAPGVYVHMASSMFMKVDLSNGITVWWDGVTRVYVDAPPSFMTQTRGMCGTFTLNQNDDFLTSENDIEQDVNAFANKWKTFQVCSDVEVGKGLRDPCDIYAQKKEQAKILCGIINSKIFSNCHELVEPEPFYKDCLYDMCSCQNEIKSCLCPSVADYGAACTKKGILIDWRNSVKECAIRCSGGQKYQVCGSSCKRSCMDIANNPKCREKCVEGCNCPEGMTLNMENECIPISSCPCLFDDKEYAAGESEVRGRDYCVCANGAWECRPATEEEILAQEARNLELKSNICPDDKNMEFTECETSCMPTCGKLNSNDVCSPEHCKPGCKCKEGYVFDPKTSECVRPSECHCHHAGKKYAEAEIIHEECNTCVCHSGSWVCQSKVCPGLCSTWGGSHFKTFDGRMFEFRGDCEYTLVRATGESGFVISVSLSACGTTDFACLDGITITVGSDQLDLMRGKEIRTQLTPHYIVRHVGLFVVVHTYVGLTLHWDKGSRVYVKMDTKWRDRLEGLCGNYNGNGMDDFQSPTGGLSVARATSFADSWKVYDYCPVSEKVNDNCENHGNRKSWAVRKCGVMKTELFAACHGEVSYEPYMERCIADTCACEMGGDCECLCTAIAAYAQECSLHGVPIKWRSQELCPIQCRTCDQYVPCMSICPPRTCDTQYTYAEIQKDCGLEMCVEGCEPPPCSPDKIFSNEFNFTCIPLEECHHPPCKMINGQMYHEGQRVTDPELVDPCQSCHCIHGELSCEGEPCETTPIIPVTTLEPKTEAPAVCKDGWTEWMNSYTPTLRNGGDYETFEELRKNGYSFCTLDDMTSIECRTIGTHSIYKETGQIVSCELPTGLVCENKDQAGVKLCFDYEIRVYCSCFEGFSTLPPFTMPEFTETPSTRRITEGPRFVCSDGWTVWMNSHTPDIDGETEMIPILRDDYHFCSSSQIKNIECRDVSSKEASSQSLIEGLECTTDRGFVCRNKDCPDYEVRFFCECERSQCNAERGMGSNSIKDYQITASSFLSSDDLPYNGRLYNNKAWTAKFQRPDQWIQIELEDKEEITGIETQGHPQEDSWVTIYKVDYSIDGVNWNPVERVARQGQEFPANEDATTTVRNDFEAVEAKYIRVNPVDWVGRISMRLEIYGCNRKEYPLTTAASFVSPFPAICYKTGWTDWMNIDSPDNIQEIEEEEENEGDHELIEELRHFYSFCPNPTSIECRVAHTNTASHLTGQDVHCESAHGLRCINKKQKGGKCLDYEIRLYCECEATTIAPTTAIPTSEITPRCPSNNQGFTDWMNSDNPKRSNGDMETYNNLRRKYSFCDQRFITSIQCRVAGKHIPYNEAGQLGVVCDLNLGLQCENSLQKPNGKCKDYEVRFYCTCLDLTLSTLPPITYQTAPSAVKNLTTIVPSPMTVSVPPKFCDEWTHWISLDTPDADGIESELTEELFEKDVCPQIMSTQCRDVKEKKSYNKYKDLKFDIKCTREGIVCDESKNGFKICPDFEISVFCICPTTAPPTSPTPKREYPCVQGWTEWINMDSPNSGEGDLELIENIREKYDFCAPEDITEVECAVVKDKPENNVNYAHTRDFAVKCNKQKGLICYNDQQSRKCQDYSIRFYCQCGAEITETSPPPMTTTPSTTTTPEYVITIPSKKKISTFPTGKPIVIPTSTLQPQVCGWTQWMNLYHPVPNDISDGDYEAIEDLSDAYGICSGSALRAVECRTADTWIPVDTAGQIGVLCDSVNGLKCENRLQLYGCYDYEVRAYCMYDWCNETTTAPPATAPTSQPTTTPPCSPGEEWSDCAYRCDHMCQSYLLVTTLRGECDPDKGKVCVPGCVKSSCEPPRVWRDEHTCIDSRSCTCIIEKTGDILAPSAVIETDCERCQCLNNTLTCTMIPGCGSTPPTEEQKKTPKSSIETGECWTEWVNIDTPDSGMGDHEDLMEIRERFEFCSNPVKIECRVADSKISAFDAGQQIECSLVTGLTCWNSLNSEKSCYDYEVRFYCPCVTTTTPVYALRTKSTTPKPVSPVIGKCIQGLTEWFSANVPDKSGEHETLAVIRQNKNVFCGNEYITAIECRSKSTKRSYDQSNSRGAVCNLREGFHCRNEDQLPGETCEDFEVRFLCDCGYTTLPPSTAKTTTPSFSLGPRKTRPFTVATTEMPTVPPCSEFIYALAPLPDSHIRASSSRSPLLGPQNVKLGSKPGPNNGGAWTAGTLSPDEYLLIDLGSEQPVYGIITQGHASANEWVKTYNLLYSKDGNDFTMYKTFVGNQDNVKKSKHLFEKPFIAKYVKIQPLSWQGQISMRLELLSCAAITSSRAPATTTTVMPSTAPPCTDSMGMEDGQLNDFQISASSSRDELSGPSRARLNTSSSFEGSGGWMAKVLDRDQYLQIDFLEPRILTGVVTQGRDGEEQWLTAFYISYSNDGSRWETIKDEDGPDRFSGNYDSDTPAVSLFHQPIRARYLRINPDAWHNWISLRLEVLGCFEQYPTTTTPEGIANLTATSPAPVVCHDFMGLQNGEISDDMISVSSSINGPNSDGSRVRLDTKDDDSGTGGWIPETDDGEQYITIDLKEPRNLTGIILQGRDGKDEWVTDYTVLAWNGQEWEDLENSQGNPIFTGNTDSSTPVTSTFNEMIETSMLRIVPAEWHNWPSLRLELIGCFHPYPTEAITEGMTSPLTFTPEVIPSSSPPPQIVCDDLMGIENGAISDDMIIVSSTKDGHNSDGSRIRLNTKEDVGTGGWVPETADTDQFVIIDFKEPRNVTGIILQGRDGTDEWVTDFTVAAWNGQQWEDVENFDGNTVFAGNTDSSSPVTSNFKEMIETSKIQISPLKWHDWPSMRLEVTGCFHPYPTETTTVPELTSPVTVVEVCNDVMGLENGEISDDMIIVSSTKDGENSDGSRVRLNTKEDVGTGGWVPETADTEQFIIIDFKEPRNLTGITLQGRDGTNEWVTEYTVAAWNGQEWEDVPNSDGNTVFLGNIDSSSPVTSKFGDMIETSKIQISPLKWHDWPSMRLEVIGCFHPYPTEITTEMTSPVTMTTVEVTPPSSSLAPSVCDDLMGLENGDVSDDMIIVSSTKDGHNSDGSRMRLNTKEDVGTGGWVPETADTEQFVVIDFKQPRNVTGIILQGRDGSNEWITHYTVAAWNGQQWEDVENSAGNTVFDGNADSSTPVTSKFEDMIETSKIQISPLEWQNWPSMRLELVGCFHPYLPEVCEEPMGLEDGSLLDSEITVSSSLAGDQSGGARVRLNTLEENDTGGWVAATANTNQFVQLDFGYPVNLTGVVTQGRNKHKEWVTRYRVMSSIDGSVWRDVRDRTGGDVFLANSDENTPVKRLFQNSIMAQYIRIRPVAWNKWIAMRIEVLGCKEVVPTTPRPPQTTTIKTTITTMPATTTMIEECIEYGPWLNLHTPSPSNEGDHEPIKNIIFLSHLCKNPIEIECREVMNQQDYATSGQNVTCDLNYGLRCRHVDQQQKYCYDYEVRIGCYTCEANATTPSALVPTCPEISQENSYDCPTTCSPGMMCDGEKCVHVIDCPCYQNGKKFMPGEKVINPECLECSCWMGGHSHCVNRICPPCEEGEKPVDHRNCTCECEPCPTGTILCPTTKVCISEDKWCDGILDCLDDEKNCPTTPLPTTTCPPPLMVTCPAGTMLIIDPESVCPEYTCVPVPTPPTTPAPPGEADCEVNSNHFKTFDDLEYQYEICDNILLQDKVEKNFNVSLQKNCIPETKQCTKSVIINQDSNRFVLGGDLSVEVNDLQYTASQLVKIGKNQNEFNVKIVGDTVIFKSQKYGFNVEWDIRMNLKIGVSDDLIYRVNGMCGFYSKTGEDERQKPNEEQAVDFEDFGDSWLIGPKDNCEPQTCPPEAIEEAIATCNALKLSPFDVCHEKVPIELNVEMCNTQMCDCLLNTNKTDKECRCQVYLNYAQSCQLKDTEWRVQYGCVPKCPPGHEWHDCGSNCERTCENIHENLDEMNCNSDACIAGCFCPPGLVKKGEKCIEKEKCLDCVCKGYGDPHYYSFDGHYYPFQGNCTYVLARDQVPEGEEHKFEVYATNEDCKEEPNTTCTVEIMVFYNGHIAHYRINESITFDGLQMEDDDLPFEAFGINITNHKSGAITFVIEEVHLEVRYFTNNYGFEIKVPSEIYYNKTEGLCGLCNYDKSDDQMHKDGYVTNDTDDFALSWIARPPEQFEAENEICKVKEKTVVVCTHPNDCDVLTGPLFRQCNNLIDPEPYLMACRFDICHSIVPTDSLCRSLMEYARVCAREGICLSNWRSDSLCPHNCPEGMYYDQCGSACMRTCRTKDRYQDVNEDCPLDVTDGCFCIGNTVLKNGTCVDPLMCEICDEQKHKIGDVWKPNPCKTCTCDLELHVECTIKECSLKPTCKVDESLRVTPADEFTCCDKYECVPLPPPVCNDTEIPLCSPGEVLQLKKTPENCPFYECVCDPDQCPAPQVPNVNPGEEVVLNKEGCCYVYDVTCKSETCPKLPDCDKFSSLKKRESSASKCCPEYYCEPLKDVCIYTHTMSPDQSVPLDEANRYRKSYKPNEEWNDGPCINCKCVGNKGDYSAECITIRCPRDSLVTEEYVYTTDLVPGECCPFMRPVMCVIGGENYTIGEEVASPDGDKCKKVHCERTENGYANKVEVSKMCAVNCRPDEEYVADPLECCGSCQKVACSDPDMPNQIHQVGERWPSPNNSCEHRECINETAIGVTLMQITKNCPVVPEECLPENIVKDEEGCCDLCKELPPTACTPQLYEGDTTEYFEIFQKGEICTNKKPIEGFMECKGKCESFSYYKAESQAFESTCKCCSPDKTEKKVVQLDCSDGSTTPYHYEQPKSCLCSECSGLQEDVNHQPLPPPRQK